MADNKPLIDRMSLEENFSNPRGQQVNTPVNIPYVGLDSERPIGSTSPDEDPIDRAMRNISKTQRDLAAPLTRPLSKLSSERYDYFVPGDYNNEDAYGQGQGWGSKMVSGVGKGLVLTGTTFLQTTVGLVNGAAKAINDGKFSSFYDNEFNRQLDEINKQMENILPNYYTDAEKNAHWYSGRKLFSANFLWDGIVKNLGFAAGAALSGGVFAAGIKAMSALPGLSRLVSVGKMAEALAATEAEIAGTANAAATFGRVKNLSDQFLSAYKVLSPGGRALVAGLATSGEAGIEAFHNMNEYRDELIRGYVDDYGYEPTSRDLEDINEQAAYVGNRSFVLNMGLLSATNYIQFPKILGSSYKAEKGIINSTTKKIGGIVEKEGKYIATPARGGRVLSTLNKIRPYTFSISEGFEEGAQYAITVGTQDYYDKKYNGEGKANILDSVFAGIKETVTTDEGMENILIGGLSGAIMLGRGKFKAAQSEQANTEQAIKAFNKFRLSDFTKETLDSVVRGTTLQEEREQALKDGNIVDSKDLEADYIINYLTPRIKFGRFDLVNAEIEDYRRLASTEEGFAQLQAEGKALESDTRQAYLDRLAAFERTALNVKSLYQSLNVRYSGITDKNGNVVYSPEVIDKMVYAATKIADYDVRIPELKNKLAGAVLNIDEVLNAVHTGDNKLYEEALAIVQASEDINKDELAQSLADAASLTVRRKKFLDDYQKMKTSPTEFKETKTRTETTATGETVKIKTKVGERDLEIGTEYYVGRIVEQDKDGNEVYRPNTITILKDNGDGTLRIRDKNGKERDIKASVLEDYRLGKVSAVENNPTAKFFMRNWNNVVYWNTGKKKAGKVAGRLEHDPTTNQLYFTYATKSKKGKRYVKRIPVDLNSFNPKQGYTEAIFSFGRELTAEDKSDIDNKTQSLSNPEEMKLYQVNTKDGRRNIIADFIQELQERHKDTKKRIEQRKTDVRLIEEDLQKISDVIANSPEDKRGKREINLRPTARKAIDSARRLSRAKEEIEEEIELLETEVAETEIILSYLEDSAQNIGELAKDTKQMMEDLGFDVMLVEDSIEQTNKEISSLTRLLDKIESGYEAAIDFLNSLIDEFKKKYPNVPAVMGQEWIDFLKANPRFLKYKPAYKDDLRELEQIVATIEDTEITPNEGKVTEYRNKIAELKAELADAEKELLAKQAILDRFQKAVDVYKVQQAEESIVKNNKKLVKDAMKTADDGNIETVNKKEGYEPNSKKLTDILWRSTIGVQRGKPHQERANRFGFRLAKLPNRNKIRGVYVTANNEDQLIPGLIDHLRKDVNGEIDESIDRTQIIAMVMVDDEGNLINENGEVVTGELLDNAIYQVFPLAKLKWSNGESMFREGTPDEVKEAITEQYDEWRKEVLNSSTIGEGHEIEASFGIPVYTEYRKEDGSTSIDYTARTPVEDAGLVEEDDYYGEQLIFVPSTNNTISQGTTSYNSPLGIPFLQLPNGALPLQNRQHTKQEANTIYEVLLQLATNMVDPKIGVKNEKSERLINYLRSVVYWGTPKTESPQNNIFFTETEEGKFVLTMSGVDQPFAFTPSKLMDNKDIILEVLQEMYANVNKYRTELVNEPYEEITGIDEQGEPVSRTWINYQTYLLSTKFIANDNAHPENGKVRTNVPLSTVMQPLDDTESINRKGIYFYTTDTADDFDIPETVEEEAEEETKTPSVLRPVKASLYNYDGKTENTLTKNGKTIVFTVTEDGEVSVLPKGDVKTILAATKENIKKTHPEYSTEEVSNIAKASIKAIVYSELGVKKPTRKPIADENADGFTVDELVGEGLSPIPPVKKAPVQKDEDGLTVEELLAQEGEGIDDVNRAILDAMSDVEGDDAYREVVSSEVEPVDREDWNKVEKWLKKNFPNVPVYRVRNLIQATNGRQAWGMFQKGAIYLYQHAEAGTAYHEVFEAVWKMFTPVEEQSKINNEFKQRKGTFVDRPSGKRVKYSEATNQQIKEQLAEEFRDYVQDKKIPKKPDTGRPYVLKLFSDLINFIRKVFMSPNSQSLIEEMFSNINEGHYKSHIPFENQLAFAEEGFIDIEDAFGSSDSEFSLVGITDKERSEIIQNMTYLTLKDIVKNDKNLFNVMTRNRTELYSTLKHEVLRDIARKIATARQLRDEGKFTDKQIEPVIKETKALMNAVSEQWEEIVSRHEEYLKGYQIEFDENDELQITDEDKIKESDYVDANKVDHFKKANVAVKLLLATVPVVNEQGKMQRSSVGGAVLIPISQTYISMMNNLHDARNMDDMILKLREMAKNDPNYRTLYKRITKTGWETAGVDLEGVKNRHGARLLAAMWKTFKKQNPEVKNVYILDHGEVVVGDANLSTAAAQLRDDYINSIVIKAKEGTSFFKYDKQKKVYKGDPKSVKDVKLSNVSEMANFLKKLGIPFKVKDAKNLRGKPLSVFKEAVSGIKASIQDGKEIATFTGKALDINGRLLQLGYVQSSVNNPEFDSTFFNIVNERTQSFIGTNPASDLYDFISQIDRFDEPNLSGTQYEYLLKDVFAKGSVILNKIFTPKGARKRTKDSDGLLKVVYVSGTDNQQRGRQRQSSKLNYKERLVQELNLNIAGYYLNLVPGDASMEWALYTGNHVSVESLKRNLDDFHLIVRDYFKAELELVREDRPVARGRKSNEMRFFKTILGEKLHNRIIAEQGTVDEVYSVYENRIKGATRSFITEQNEAFKNNLIDYNILTSDDTGWMFENVSTEQGLTDSQLEAQLSFFTTNFMINNIEMHKLLYSDPYQYSDELKRIKNFNSPRQALIHNSPKMNSVLHKIWNRGFKRGELGWTKFNQDYFRTTTLQDVFGIVKEFKDYNDPYDETDGGGVITYPAYRQFRIRTGDWNDSEEVQYRYDIAFEKDKKGMSLTEEEQELLADGNPKVKSAYTPLKPIVSGNKGNNKPYNDVLLDKFALYPISYRLMSDLAEAGGKSSVNAIAVYEKMQKEDIDYAVFESGRKVGAVSPNAIYNEDGSINQAAYAEESIVNVPFAIMSVQTEVPSKDVPLVTRGSQVTKLVTMDYMEAGVPTDFLVGQNFTARYNQWYKLSEEEKVAKSPIYKEISNNQNLLEGLMEIGYQNLLVELGISEENGRYTIYDNSNAAETLRNEILKREVNDNTSDALQSFLEGKAILEATPAYHQVRNILYSIADKRVMSPKITGGMKVLIPSALLESVRAKQEVVNGTPVYTSDTLEFYKKDGKQVCEIMVGRWFDSKLSDKDLLDYLNKTEEGQKVLSGLAFRIPTQKQNSIESFVIKQFLPKEFGDSVVLPAAMVTKTGADFDIDKLTMYLKNVFNDVNNEVKIIPYYGIGQAARDKFAQLFDEGKFLSKGKYKELQEELRRNKEGAPGYEFIKTIFGDLGVFTDEEITEDFIDKVLKGQSKELVINKLYQKSLENAYIESSQNLVSHPSNFERLIKPNSADQLKGIAKFIANKTVGSTFDYKDVGNMIDRTFMSRLRHAFISGKYAIGISAVNQTNHSLNQRQPIYIDPERLEIVSAEDKEWLKDASIRFDKYNTIEIDGKRVATLSMVENVDGQDISDIIAQFIDGYVDISKGPWIMELGATPNVSSTFLFLAKIGVPIDTVAYFMNQPIIRNYLRSIENAGYSWLFMKNFVESTKELYDSGRKTRVAQTTIPSKAQLKELVGKKVGELNKEQLEQQQFILDEFLKYAKMAEHMFHVSQGSNFDTANFNDPYLVFKKFEQLKKARQSIISDVDELMSNSFIGRLAETIQKTRNALSTVLISDREKVRRVIEKVLLPYVDMRDRDFVKISQKAVSDLFDYAVQTDQKLNLEVRDILINDGGVGTEVAKFMNQIANNPKHPLYDNYIIGKDGIMRSLPNKKASDEGVNNIRVKGLGNKAYDQNNIIYAFREIREYLYGKSPLYNRIVELAVLQSGLSHSGISFTSVIPHEDFEKIYNKTLSRLSTLNLQSFLDLNVFQRNNWNNDVIVPYTKAAFIKTADKTYYNLPMSFFGQSQVKKAIENNDIPQLMTVRQFNREASSNHIVYTWEKFDELLPEDWKRQYPRMGKWQAIKTIKQEMRSKGDYSYINKGLFEKVTNADGTPFETEYTNKKGEVIPMFLYKAINAWGDGHKANEFYDVEHVSVIDNGFIKVEGVDNSLIIDIFTGEKKVNGVKSKRSQPRDYRGGITTQEDWQNTDNTSDNPFKC